LAISRVEAGVTDTACDPAVVAGQLREELEPKAESSHVSLSIDVQPAKVHCSEGLLRQVLWNLADNAIKYRRSEVPAHVEICRRAAGGCYEVSVKDNGRGIGPRAAARVFEPFYRASAVSAEPSTGLGLSIVKRVVEANGGTVSLTSDPGHSSR